MKKLLILLTVLLVATVVSAQEVMDAEMQRLTKLVASLRTPDKTAWNKASETFGSDQSWTLMDETVRHQNECRLTDTSVKWFSLNRMLTKRRGYDSNKTRGEFNNGENPNFNYSLIERSVQGGKSVSYSLKAREGKQLFVIIPYDAANSKMTAAITVNGKKAEGRKQPDGSIHIAMSQHIKPNDVLTLSVTNKQSKGQAFVILNHNTRKK